MLWQYLAILVAGCAAVVAFWIALMKWQEGVIRREEAEEPRGFPVKPVSQKKGHGSM
jgi:hypothetical protein